MEEEEKKIRTPIDGETAFSCLKKTLGVCLCRQVSKYDKRKIL